MKVSIYRNLNRNLFSIKANTANGSRVIGYCTWAILNDVQFHISEAGRNRAVLSKCRNVHAFVRGYIEAWHGHDMSGLLTPPSVELPPNAGHEIYYNPFKTSSFMVNGMPIFQAKKIVLLDGRKLHLCN